MKNLIILVVLLFNVEYLEAQNCNQLFISEIVFGKIQNVSNQSNLNHSIEIFNPREEVVNLSGYSIIFYTGTHSSETISLSGIIPAQETYVISNPTASPSILNVSNVFDVKLNFEGKGAMELIYNGEVIDQIGIPGDATDISQIDLEQLLNDPDYAATLNLNLSSIENLLIQRRRDARGGTSQFETSQILEQWLIYPFFYTEDLGYHMSACIMPMLQWRGFTFQNITEWEKQIFESDGGVLNSDFPPPLEWIDGTVELTETVDNDVTFEIFTTNYEYVGTMDNPASNIDFDGNFVGEFTIATGDRTFPISKLIYPVVDNDNAEKEEGVGLRIVPFPSSGVVANDQFDVLDMRIIELLMSSEELEQLETSIKSYPFIVEDVLYLENNSANVSIEGIQIYDFSGKLWWAMEYDHSTSDKIHLNFNEPIASGYKLLIIQTNKGSIAKKFFKK